ncbi:MAG: hypothetical protein ABIQ31_05485 [Ferruginibacter sp.]
MKPVCIVILSIMLLVSSCKKESLITEDNNNTPSSLLRLKPRFPPLPRPVLPMSICINSYDELIQLLGSSQVTAQSVILSTGVIMWPGIDLQSINYEAVPQNQPNSLFGSRLIVEWRFPGGNWQLNISDVWSLGCVYQAAGEPPYTNLIKGDNIIQINTCFFWGTDSFTGERIEYVVID